MAEKITSLRAQSGGATARTLSREWHVLPKSMKWNAFRLIVLLGILFVPALRMNAETVVMITSQGETKNELRHYFGKSGQAALQTQVNSICRMYWEQVSDNPWGGLLHFTPSLDYEHNGNGCAGYDVPFYVQAYNDYRIMKVIFRDTEGYYDYNDKNHNGADRLLLTDKNTAGNYKKYFDENACDPYVDPDKRGKYQDHNNLVFELVDGEPASFIWFKTHNNKDKNQFKTRTVFLILKKVNGCRFSQDIVNLKVGETLENVFYSPESARNLDKASFNITNGNAVLNKNASGGFDVKGVTEGQTTFTVTVPEDNDYLPYSATLTVNVTRNEQPATLSSSSPVTMYAWDTPALPTVQNKPADYTGQIVWTSSDEKIAKVENGKIVFGGSGYGQTATITAELPGDTKYKAKKISFDVTVRNEMRIASKDDWDQFCNQVNTLNNGGIKATLTKDITTPVTTSAGFTWNSYRGTFEGNNHSIALAIEGGEYVAPFRAADGATISNLTVTGKISASGKFAGSLVALVQGSTVTIDHCQSSVTIYSKVDGDGTHGGLVGLANKPVKINNCIFSGSMIGANTNNCGGLVGWIDGGGQGSQITNCLITATYSVVTDGCDAVARNGNGSTINKVYILKALGNIPDGAEQVGEEKMKSGYAAWNLQNGQNKQIWGQTVNASKIDAAPLFSDAPAKKVYRVAHISSLDNNVVQEKFYNSGQTAQDLATSSFAQYVNTYKDLTHWYQVTGKGSVTTPVTADQNVKVTIKDDSFIGINSADTWKQFCDYVNDVSPKVSAKMTSNVNLTSASPMAGNKQAYTGHFYGEGKTLTVNYTGTGQATAPFNVVEGAVIENLKTAGTITQTGTGKGYPQSHASGLVGSAKGVTINNCEVAVAISFTLTGDPDQHSGGFVGHGQGSVIKMNNCKFSGSFIGADGTKTSGIAGLVGWSAGTGSSFNNCYVAGTYKNIVDVHPLVYTSDQVTVNSSNNFYCFNGIGASKWRTYGTATPVTADQAKSGSVTWSLQHGTEAKVWSQSLPGDNEPMLVFSGAKTVNKVDFVQNKTVKFTRYANSGNTLVGGVPTLKDFMGNDYKDTYYYETFTFSPDFKNDSPVSKDTRVTVALTYKDYFTVNTKAAWNQFCTLVNNGSTKLAAKMTADVNDAVTTMAGTSDKPYQGIFDGQGHTLTVNLNGGQNVAPFSVINGATVKNLSVAGNITASNKYAAGIASSVTGKSAISQCESKVTINSTVNGDGTHGGIVAVSSNGAGVDISNCIFSGELKGEATDKCGGILGWPSGASTISHCLVTATFTTGASNSSTFTRNAGQATITNCYYLKAYGTPQGEQVKEDQLKNGYVASKLQAGNTGASVWAFSLGSGTMLHVFYEKKAEETPNYVYYYSEAKRWRCKHYLLTDSEPYQDSYVEFTADKISYARNLQAGRCYTWYQPYALTYKDALPFKAYRLTGSSDRNAIFTQLNDGEILKAFSPYLILMKEAKNSFDCPETIVQHYEKGNDQSVQEGGISMAGTLTAISNADASQLGAYIMQSDNTWKKVIAKKNSNAYIPPFRAYLTSIAHGAKIGSVFSDDITTGVENVILKDCDGTTHIYDLRGVDRGTDFDSLPMGIYIRDGKKIVKK